MQVHGVQVDYFTIRGGIKMEYIVRISEDTEETNEKFTFFRFKDGEEEEMARFVKNIITKSFSDIRVQVRREGK